jgi:hypothetical protein
LKTSTGTTIKTISLNDTDRAVILLAVWVWRDILVTMMANHKMKDHKVISTLTDIRESVQEPYYNELLDVRGLRPLDEFSTSRRKRLI